jgi:hypothetical protein
MSPAMNVSATLPSSSYSKRCAPWAPKSGARSVTLNNQAIVQVVRLVQRRRSRRRRTCPSACCPLRTRQATGSELVEPIALFSIQVGPYRLNQIAHWLTARAENI